ncbi:Uncharacterised protein [Citrobacter freundii]|nr:Uncharacterised protein [Citrobacter freundii]
MKPALMQPLDELEVIESRKEFNMMFVNLFQT